MRRFPLNSLIAAALLLAIALPADSLAFGLKDLKKKAQDKIKEVKETKEELTGTPAAGAAEAASDEEPASKGGAASAADASVNSVSTKFDFVPGDKVILMDDFTRDELGEFPSRWRLVNGNFDIAEAKGSRWLRLNGNYGVIAIKGASLPTKWTLEFDIDQRSIYGSPISVGGLLKNSSALNWFASFHVSGVSFQGLVGSHPSSADLPGGMKGSHHVSVMGNGTGIKLYVDHERLVNVPEMDTSYGLPVALALYMQKTDEEDPKVTNVRFAEGGKPKVDLLAAPFVTHGIRFATGSDRVLPESAPVLRQIAAYLKENAGSKVLITGHTDDVGEAASNLALSQARAKSVASSLAQDFGIEAERMSAAGKGESAPMAANESPEGKAMNRRVEFSRPR